MRPPSYRLLAISLTLLTAVVSALGAEPTFEQPDLEFFEKRVRPILVNRCYECHSQAKGKERGGLVLDERAAILTGGDSGPAVVPHEADKSLLVEALRYDPNGLQMPPTGKLPAAEIEILTDWVKRGLPHPTAEQTQAARKGIDLATGRKHWAFLPLSEQPLPANIDPALFGNRIDLFLEIKRVEHGLKPAPQADPRTLLRRAAFALHGLPPTMAEVEAAQAAPSFDDHYAASIDRLLASPHYGERWGRYWLDLARYADVTEAWREGDGQPWRYRDWVVQALNDDLPYDEFVRRQLAADLLPDAKVTDNAALGFLGLSPTYWKELKLDHQVIKQVVAEEWEERLDALGATFLGLTIGCARCHDHKFDPITAQDYYALAGVLASVRTADRFVISDERAKPAMAARDQARELDAKLKSLLAKKPPSEAEQAEISSLQSRLTELRKTPDFDLPLACGVTDSALHVVPDGKSATRLDYRPGEAQDVALHIRGNPGRTGAVVPRRFVSVLARDPEATFRQGSGRLELARALVDDAAPLSARVMVNRVWKQHFGRGIVETPSNFGFQGSPPSHRELLDDLAFRFVAHGWSLKWLHREIMTSAAYRQSSQRDAASYAIDPDNRWLWRMTPRALDVESWRDAVITAADGLEVQIGGAPSDLANQNNRRRTIYGIVKRREVSELLRLFDFPDPVAHSAQREPTITPLQQLFVLNSPFFEQQSRTLVEQISRGELENPKPDNRNRITAAYQRLFQRQPLESDLQLGERYVSALREQGIAEQEAWRQYVHVLLASNEFLFID